MAKTNPWKAKLSKGGGGKPNPFVAKIKAKSAVTASEPPRQPSSPWGRRAQEKRSRQERESDKRDVTISGVRIHTVRQHPFGFWTIQVTNGDETTEFHNRYGAWFTNVGDMMREPRPWLAFELQTRWLTEMKARGIQIPYLMAGQERKKAVNGKSEQEEEETPKPRTRRRRRS